MLLQVASDLHLETYPTYGSYKHHLTDASYLALLGDIGHVNNADFKKLIVKLLDHYSLIFYVLGNHDPKGLPMEAVKQRLRGIEASLSQLNRERTVGRFVFLDQNRFDIDARTTVLGCTLYSYVPEKHLGLVGDRMIEFRETPGWTVEQHVAAHKSDVAWLDAEVERIEKTDPLRSIIIMSHHCPTKDSRARNVHFPDSPMSFGFATDLSEHRCWTSPQVSIWAWGHTHWNCDFEVDRPCGRNFKCFTNQKGYFRNPQDSYDAGVMIDLPHGRTHRMRAAASPIKAERVSLFRRLFSRKYSQS